MSDWSPLWMPLPDSIFWVIWPVGLFAAFFRACYVAYREGRNSRP